MRNLRSKLIRLAHANPEIRSTLIGLLTDRDVKKAAWNPPKLDKSLAALSAKDLKAKPVKDRIVESLNDIRKLVGNAVTLHMSMRDVSENQAAIKKWTASLSKEELIKFYRDLESELNKGKATTYTKDEEALRALNASQSKRAEVGLLSYSAYVGMNAAVGNMEDKFREIRSKTKEIHVKKKIDLALKALQDVTNCLDYMVEDDAVERGL